MKRRVRHAPNTKLPSVDQDGGQKHTNPTTARAMNAVLGDNSSAVLPRESSSRKAWAVQQLL